MQPAFIFLRGAASCCVRAGTRTADCDRPRMGTCSGHVWVVATKRMHAGINALKACAEVCAAQFRWLVQSLCTCRVSNVDTLVEHVVNPDSNKWPWQLPHAALQLPRQN